METVPSQVGVERDPKSIKIKIGKRGQWCKSRGARLEELSKWSMWSKNSSQRKVRVVRAQVEKGPREEDRDVLSATIVAETISCGIARNGRRKKRNFVPPRETKSLAPFTHTDGLLGWNSYTNSRRQRGRR